MEPVRADEVRILEGPNLYVNRPAVKVSLVMPGQLGMDGHGRSPSAGGWGWARPGQVGPAPDSDSASS